MDHEHVYAWPPHLEDEAMAPDIDVTDALAVLLSLLLFAFASLLVVSA